MKNDTDAILDDLLSRWHNWSKHTADRAGLPGKAPAFGQSLSNSQFDWENGIEDDYVERRIMQGFDAAMSKISGEQFTALTFEARNLSTGRQVWLSPRLPTGEALQALRQQARATLARELAKDGVIC